MALAEEIEELVRLKPGLTEIDLARMVQSPGSYQLQVRFVCRRLVAEGLLERQGKGGWLDPFTYHPPTLKRRASQTRRLAQLKSGVRQTKARLNTAAQWKPY